MVSANKKGLQIKRVIKSAARLPARVRVSGGRGSGRSTFSPLEGEAPVVILRVQIIGCSDLVGKDKHGSSDPFVVVSLLNSRHQTPVTKRNVNPTFLDKDATFDFPIYLSLADRLGALELVVWDKDRLRKEYLGEVSVSFEDWFRNGTALGFLDSDNEPRSLELVSTRAATRVTGSVTLKLGFVYPPSSVIQTVTFDQVLRELVKRSRPSLVSAPATEGIGTIRSYQIGPIFEDDGGISSDEDEPGSEEDEEENIFNSPLPITNELPASSHVPPITVEAPSIPVTPTTPTTPTAPSSSKASAFIKHSGNGFKPRLVFRKSSVNTTSTSDMSELPRSLDLPSPPVTPGEAPKRPGIKHGRFSKSWVKKKEDYNFSASNDIVGIIMLEIQSATDLPKFKNMTRLGWDMDPFVVISFGKKVFRTRVIRHSLNPVWDEKLLFHVRRYEVNFKVQLTVLDWDKLSSNDHVGDTTIDLSDLIASAPQPDPETGLYPEEENVGHAMIPYQRPLTIVKDMPQDSKHTPVLTFRAKYQPYDALRQRFWRQYLSQYDTDDTGSLSLLELSSMLDSLGSTLSSETIESYFARHGKKAGEEELTISEAIQCLEAEVCRPTSERKTLDGTAEDSPFTMSTSPGATPMLMEEEPKSLRFDSLDFSGPQNKTTDFLDVPSSGILDVPNSFSTEPMELALSDVADSPPETSTPVSSTSTSIGGSQRHMTADSQFSSSHAGEGRMARQHSNSSSDVEELPSSNHDTENSGPDVERVINIKNCPLCHRPRLTKKAEKDIVTHLAVCASQDWNKVDRIMVSNFVTASQAQRKWYTKVITKVSSGNYKLGANSANIIVQNRLTGQLEEEKMQVYVRLGIRLLYKGAKSRMEGARARRLLKSMSIKQGQKYDSPDSVRDIMPFIEFHKLNTDELLEPISSFKTFNEFFYRKLKPDARLPEESENPNRLVSAADCRFMAFESTNEATKLWIKGREFSIARLLGEDFKGEAERYNGGALAIFRLAPQDYHRFHSPVDGTIGRMSYISGEYYTVNPQAIRTALDVYGENARKIISIDSPQFGRVMAACIGAMMVGSIKTTVEEGQQVKRGQELGYFAFGGSTVVVLFERGIVQWDEDLLINGRASLETLVRVGMGIGRRRGPPSTKPNAPSTSTTMS